MPISDIDGGRFRYRQVSLGIAGYRNDGHSNISIGAPKAGAILAGAILAGAI
jgi:hypothetical protein